MARVGLVANPAAGRDIRRLTGGAVVSDNYAKRRAAASVLEGLSVHPGIEVLVAPDEAGIGEYAVSESPDEVSATLLDVPTHGTREDTRLAAARFRDETDVAVVLGGDGTVRDVVSAVGSVPLVAVSTGTNNVVPDHVDGAVAGVAAAFVADGTVPIEEVAIRHSTVEATIAEPERKRSIRSLATMGVVDRPFVGTRAVLNGEEFVGGVVSRAGPHEIGLSGIVGGVVRHPPDAPGGVGVRLGPPDETPRTVDAVTVPGVLEPVGVADYRLLDDGEEFVFEVETGVVSVDGERDVEVTDAEVAMSPSADGPYVVQVERTLAAAADRGGFDV
ncbi:NAD(+)/NADH kinase [Haloplanus sp. GCM10025708]|uniref:NAD(+)/NADH kinase n=1 Tax=Haloferacaceae TaxID=1644056 RepID=UPI00361F2FE2